MMINEIPRSNFRTLDGPNAGSPHGGMLITTRASMTGLDLSRGGHYMDLIAVNKEAIVKSV